MSTAQRHPPALRIEVSAQPRLQLAVALLAMLSWTSLVAGLAQHLPGLAWLMLAVPVVGLAGWRLARAEPRRLQWDGQTWRLGAAAQVEPGADVDLESLFDFGDWLLLRAQPPGAGLLPRRRSYLPLSRRAVGADWGRLRATLYSARPRRPAAA